MYSVGRGTLDVGSNCGLGFRLIAAAYGWITRKPTV
jgi:hypothetical protein